MKNDLLGRRGLIRLGLLQLRWRYGEEGRDPLAILQMMKIAI